MTKIPFLRMSLTQQQVQNILNYDPSTGEWTWLVDRNYKTKAGMKAGCLNISDGRMYIKVHSIRYSSSRLAWFYMTGTYPRTDVDHHDGNKLNNKWGNLRLATRTQNQGNARSRTALKGVTRVRTGKYTAQIQISMKKTHLGTFDTPEEAHAAYAQKAIELYGEFARTS